MKYIFLILSVLVLSSCSLFCPKDVVNVPVWTPPTIDMPHRPVLKSINNSKLSTSTKNDGISKNVQIDMNDLSLYATQLENTLEIIRTYKPSTIQPVGVK